MSFRMGTRIGCGASKPRSGAAWRNGKKMKEFLPGVPKEHVLKRLARAGGNEIGSGKFRSPKSSAALAVNTFGWFIEQPELLTPFPDFALDYPAQQVEIEYSARFPWSGGRHPWLDAAVETPTHLIGIESKRFEPYRGRKNGRLSDAYNRKCWGDEMGPFEKVRDLLRSHEKSFQHLDAVQLVKHAFGLVTDANRKKKVPILFYLFAEPESVSAEILAAHRQEICEFEHLIAGAAVKFGSCSYREWLSVWPREPKSLSRHRDAILRRFAP